ncbi:hypothetical protein M3I53_31175 [Paraburkholderia sp. CNPSo 3272]|uniref:hypothetical protein n=1 Tax=Paraburkholderia sp. CNPSo 3272 TaxID=2940931 RepID=UPI0020B77BA0|nr:hypothetical protein [Paraburkholderia sp. CNPSo 3272]MCP3727529.1 hypothetical protein [Paraburkholderia sp. CNPSo 3272]
MDLDDLQAAYEASAEVKGRFEDQVNAMTRGGSSDFELLTRLLSELDVVQRRFSAIATELVAGKRGW